MNVQLTSSSIDLFIALAKDAGNWSGTPLFGGNVGGSNESKGHLTQLKKAGLVTTWQDPDDKKLSWVSFTKEGKAFAAKFGIEV